MSFGSEYAMTKKAGKRSGRNACIVIPSEKIANQQRRIQQAQKRARRYLKSGRSLVDELLAERREAAKHE
jgi:hypothetical protein